MELKFLISLESQRPTFSSNRTFMELKSGRDKDGIVHEQVLIVPLWN